jgi:hypothetical protein
MDDNSSELWALYCRGVELMNASRKKRGATRIPHSGRTEILAAAADPSITTLHHLARALGVSMSTLNSRMLFDDDSALRSTVAACLRANRQARKAAK